MERYRNGYRIMDTSPSLLSVPSHNFLRGKAHRFDMTRLRETSHPHRKTNKQQQLLHHTSSSFLLGQSINERDDDIH
jgi:hypothetical protein